jgi:conjugal transfer pilus assembly protein TraB
MSSNANKRILQKQWLLMGGVIAAFFVIAIGAGLALDDKGKGKEAIEKPTTKPLSIGISQTDRDAAQMQETGDVAALRKTLDEMRVAAEQRQRETDDQIRALRADKGQLVALGAPGQPYDPNGSPFATAGVAPGAVAMPAPRLPGSLGASPAYPAPLTPPAQKAEMVSRLESVVVEAKPKAGPSVNPEGTVDSSAEFGRKMRVRDGTSEGFNRIGDDAPLSPNRGSGRTAETYIPAGTYIRAVMLHGLDAPTGGQAQQNPHPVLFELADDAFLPNKFRSRLKHCVITANGYGDIAAERAYIRTDRLSCIDEEGGSVDVALRGYIAGEDGKTGMRGRVVEKTGRILANAMLAAVGSGIGQAFRAQGTQTTPNLLGGATETVTDAFRAGFGSGVNRAFDRLSDYYIKVAERMFPIVEVNGGRVVDIVVSRGVSIDRGPKPAGNP